MKMKRRALAILLTLAMIFTLMPTVAFAKDEVSKPFKKSIEPKAGSGLSAKAIDDWYIDLYSSRELSWEWEEEILEVRVFFEDDAIPLEYNIWDCQEEEYVFGNDGWETVEDGSISYNTEYLEYGEYELDIRETDNPSNIQTITFYVVIYHQTPNNGLIYELNSYFESDQAGVYDYDYSNPPKGTVSVLPSIKLSNGKTYKVTTLSLNLPEEVKAIHIPATVTDIDYIGYNYYGEKIPGFTIFGKTGSPAHKYAKDNGFAFRDLDAEAAARAAEATKAKAAALAAASNINKGTVTAADIKKASSLGATTVTLGPKVKKIKKNAFKGTKITTIVVKTKKLKKGSVKGSLKGSKVKTIQVKIGSKKVNKKFVKKYKKIFTKKNAGKKAKVK